MAVERIKTAWKDAGVKLAALVSALATALTASPVFMEKVLSFIPEDGLARFLFSVGVGIVTFVIPTVTTLWNRTRT